MKFHIALITAALAASCSTGKTVEAPTSQPVSGPAAPAAAEPPAIMLKHWVAATKVRDAVISGNLTTAVAAAQGLQDEAAPDPTWDPHLAQMKQHADAVRSAESLQTAAMATANLGATCGGCHLQMGAEIGLSTGQAPPAGDDPRTHMRRHSWAVNAMWEGLIAPSDGRWGDGIGMLAERPLHHTESSSEFIATEVVTAIGERIHDLGVRGTNVTDPAERSQIFGELIAACGDCHGQTQTGPQ